MPSTVNIFNYPDTGTEPVDFSELIKKDYGAVDIPSRDKIEKLNDIRSKMARLLVSQPNTKAILNVFEIRNSINPIKYHTIFR